MILYGECSISVRGREIARRSAGEHIGEMAMLDPTAARSATVSATTDLVLASVTQADFFSLAEAHPALWRGLATELAGRLRQRAQRVSSRNDRPRVFLACSVEGLKIAQGIQAGLDHDPFDVELWTDGVFKPGNSILDSLRRRAEDVDFAVVVATPDDVVVARGEESPAPRDNILFELGLFIGQLSPSRVLLIRPRSVNIRMPSDLLGIVDLDVEMSPPYSAARLGALCTQIRSAIEELGPR
jgi:predicted nucleotide-binding protein